MVALHTVLRHLPTVTLSADSVSVNLELPAYVVTAALLVAMGLKLPPAGNYYPFDIKS